MNDPRLNHHVQEFTPAYVREASASIASAVAKLPPSAAARFRQFEGAAFAAEAAAGAAKARREEKARPVATLREAMARSDAPHPANLELLAQLEPELEHVEELLRRFKADSIAANAIYGGIQRALEALPSNARLVEVPAPELKKATLTAARETVAALKRDIHALETSAPTTEEQAATLRAAIAKRGEIGRPRLDRSGRLRTEAAANAQAAALAVMCWAFPEAVFERMVAEGALREGGTMSAAEKTAAVAALRTSLFEAEILEEALVQRDGGTRRNDADPFAILGIRVEVGTKARAA
ncbi:DNA repair exonuclease SbcCD ATPase subunit [Xanthobacter flavus]|uniref:DNA repair exonuclease SbcCD ATPase subunit n=1 Tax=Xanthobacter flavus TaxID=281 RepID=A0A9W6FKR5_XANFL|nr:hypothetical protein [Xanthobacter flavus]MDR6332905.1 DNA repair exonuclease SbcCD ATPase subunit [Xanthobacter flavus]GLI21183.1 hypothetical protein XFLAVUS301_08570 [Xanthobacter flavus]